MSRSMSALSAGVLSLRLPGFWQTSARERRKQINVSLHHLRSQAVPNILRHGGGPHLAGVVAAERLSARLHLDPAAREHGGHRSRSRWWPMTAQDFSAPVR